MNLFKENLTTKEVNKLLLATDNKGRTVFQLTAELSKPEKFQGTLNLVNENLTTEEVNKLFLISNFRRFLYAVYFLLGKSPASELYMPTFRGTLFHLHRQVGNRQSVPKRRHIKLRRRGITQKKA